LEFTILDILNQMPLINIIFWIFKRTRLVKNY